MEFLSLPVGRLEVVDYRDKLEAGSLEDKLAVQTEERQCLALRLAAAVLFARNGRHRWYRLGSRQQVKDLAQEIRKALWLGAVEAQGALGGPTILDHPGGGAGTVLGA